MRQSKSQRAQRLCCVLRVLKRSSFLYVAIAGLCLEGFPVIGGETDPYTNREVDLEDSLEILDARVNDALDRIASNWSRGCNERAFIFAVYRDLGGRHWVDKIERWAMFASEIDRLPHNRGNSVFADSPILFSTGARLGNFSRTIKLNDVYISTDKLGHFFSQGRKFYTRYERLGSVTKAAEMCYPASSLMRTLSQITRVFCSIAVSSMTTRLLAESRSFAVMMVFLSNIVDSRGQIT